MVLRSMLRSGPAAVLLALVGLVGCGTVLGLGDLVYDVDPGAGGGVGGTAGAGGMGGAVGAAGGGGDGGGGDGGGGGGVGGDLTLGEHSKGQTSDKFRSPSTHDGAVVFAFSVAPSEQVQIDELVLQLTDLVGVDPTDLSDPTLWADDGAVSGAVDAADSQLGVGTIDSSTLVFDSPFTVQALQDYLVTLSVGNLLSGDRMTVGLAAEDVSAQLGSDTLAVAVGGQISDATHQWHATDLGHNDVRLVYRDSGTPGPRARVWDNLLRSWGPPTPTDPVGGAVKWVVTPEQLASDEQLVGVLTEGGGGTELSLLRFELGSWTTDWTVHDILPADSDRRAFDLAHEAGSGNALVVYSHTSENPIFRVRRGGAWSAEQPVFGAAPGAGAVEWVELVSRPRSNEITLLYSDSLANLHGVVWDGEQWSDATHLEGALNITHFRNFAAAYEHLGGDLLVVWAHPVDTYDGFFSSTKLAGTNVFSVGLFDTILTKPGPIALAPELGSDRILDAHIEHSCGGDTCDNFEGAIWDGSGFAGQVVIDSTTNEPYGLRLGTTPVAASWVGAIGVGVGVYTDEGPGGLDWGLWTESNGWTLQPDAAMNPPMAETVNVEAHGLHNYALFVISDLDGALWAKSTTGAAWTDTEGGVALGDVSITTAKPSAATRRP